MKRRTLAIFLALVLSLGLTLPAYGAEKEYFDINDDGVLFRYTGPGGDVVVPEGVTVINKQAFDECTQMTSVVIPHSVYQIGTDAFNGCKGLTSLDIPDSVSKILTNAFGGCTNLTRVSIPDSVTSLGIGAFAYTGLTSVSIPGSVGVIQGRTFAYCENLTDVVIGEGVTKVSTMASDGTGAFAYCTSLVNVTIPDTVTAIGNSAFYNCTALTGVTIPDSVTSILTSAFMHCPNLTLYGSAGSYAETFAKNSGIPFVVGDAPHIETGNTPSTQPSTPDKPDQPTTPDTPTVSATAPADPTNDKLTINGMDATPAAYKIENANYFKLRDLAALLNGTGSQFDVNWDGATQTVSIVPGQPYEKLTSDLQGKPTASDTANLSQDVIYIEGEKAELTIYKIDNSNFVKLRDLGILLDFYVGYDSTTRSMLIDTSRAYDHNS